jgi:hypothetical protein
VPHTRTLCPQVGEGMVWFTTGEPQFDDAEPTVTLQEFVVGYELITRQVLSGMVTLPNTVPSAQLVLLKRVPATPPQLREMLPQLQLQFAVPELKAL